MKKFEIGSRFVLTDISNIIEQICDAEECKNLKRAYHIQGTLPLTDQIGNMLKFDGFKYYYLSDHFTQIDISPSQVETKFKGLL